MLSYRKIPESKSELELHNLLAPKSQTHATSEKGFIKKGFIKKGLRRGGKNAQIDSLLCRGKMRFEGIGVEGSYSIRKLSRI